VVLKGNYQFLFLDRYPINETDLVTLHITTPRRTAVGVFGGGVTVGRNGRQGFRVDVRVSVGKNQLATSLDARPASLHGQPSIALPSNTSPSIQFSSTTDTPSSLGGPAI